MKYETLNQYLRNNCFENKSRPDRMVPKQALDQAYSACNESVQLSKEFLKNSVRGICFDIDGKVQVDLCEPTNNLETILGVRYNYLGADSVVTVAEVYEELKERYMVVVGFKADDNFMQRGVNPCAYQMGLMDFKTKDLKKVRAVLEAAIISDVQVRDALEILSQAAFPFGFKLYHPQLNAEQQMLFEHLKESLVKKLGLHDTVKNHHA